MHPQLRLFTLQLFLDFRASVFPELPLIFFVTIHQVIWPSPGTLAVRVGQRLQLRLGKSGAARELGLVQIVVEASKISKGFPNTEPHQSGFGWRCRSVFLGLWGGAVHSNGGL